MSLPRIRLLEIIASVAWSGLFVLAIIYIGSNYPIQEGTIWIIIVIVGFIIAMMGTGYLLSKREE